MPRRKTKYGSQAMPTVSQYAASVAEPQGLFRTLEDPLAERDARGNLRMISGNSSVVFRINSGDRNLMLKCYTKRTLHSEKIYRYVWESEDPLLGNARLLPEELYVYDEFSNAAFYDVAVADWIDGVTLQTEIRRAVKEYGPGRIAELAREFDLTAGEILSREWAHGDLKPENIIVTPQGNMRLVDYDAMYIPPLKGMATFQTGTPAFQHPLRDEYFYNKSVDDYSIAVISVSLHALSRDLSLYERYNTSDNIILNPAEIIRGSSPAYNKVLKLFSDNGEYALYELAESLNRPQPQIPGLRGLLGGISGTYNNESEYPRPNPSEPQTAHTELKFPEYPKLTEKSGLWGYSDKRGKEVIPHIYSRASEFSESLAVVKHNENWHIIDLEGKMVFNGRGIETIKPFSEELAAFRSEGKWGFIDSTGQVAIRPEYDLAGSFHQDRAVIKTGGFYGYIDRSGRVVIDPVYEYATGFRDGQAEVVLDDKRYKLNLLGYIK